MLLSNHGNREVQVTKKDVYQKDTSHDKQIQGLEVFGFAEKWKRLV